MSRRISPKCRPRAATVVAGPQCRLITIAKDDYNRVVRELKERQQRTLVSMLYQVGVLAGGPHRRWSGALDK